VGLGEVRGGDLELREVTLPTADGPMGLHEVRGPGRARAAVVVLQEMTGINDHIKDVVGRFGAEGYHAVAPHLFHRDGDPTYAYGDHEAIMAQVARLHDRDLLMDVDATIGYLRGCGWAPESIAVVGFCIGGRVAFLAAGHHALGAAATFYGGGIVTPPAEHAAAIPALVGLAETMETPWIGFFGDLDGGIPVKDVEVIRAAFAGKDAEVVRYAGAGHAFHCDARDAYVPEAAADAWARTLAWLEGHLRFVTPGTVAVAGT
jgi:carboxymethylenebutenolidase